jgi:hypothetical protein
LKVGANSFLQFSDASDSGGNGIECVRNEAFHFSNFARRFANESAFRCALSCCAEAAGTIFFIMDGFLAVSPDVVNSKVAIQHVGMNNVYRLCKSFIAFHG